MNIIARKPRAPGDEAGPATEFILVDRGDGAGMRYVVATATAHSLAGGEWFWGHYFKVLSDALSAFENAPNWDAPNWRKDALL